jgi:hypothetical protein
VRNGVPKSVLDNRPSDSPEARRTTQRHPTTFVTPYIARIVRSKTSPTLKAMAEQEQPEQLDARVAGLRDQLKLLADYL